MFSQTKPAVELHPDLVLSTEVKSQLQRLSADLASNQNMVKLLKESLKHIQQSLDLANRASLESEVQIDKLRYQPLLHLQKFYNEREQYRKNNIRTECHYDRLENTICMKVTGYSYLDAKSFLVSHPVVGIEMFKAGDIIKAEGHPNAINGKAEMTIHLKSEVYSRLMTQFTHAPGNPIQPLTKRY